MYRLQNAQVPTHAAEPARMNLPLRTLFLEHMG